MATASALLTDVRRVAMAPSSASNGTQDSDILAMADAEIASYMVPLLMSVREEYLVCTRKDALVANKAQYRLPQRSVGAKLRDVYLIVGTQRYDLIRLEPEDLFRLNPTSTGMPTYFYLEAGKIVLVPTPATASGYLIQKYFCAPGQLTTSTPYSVSAITIDSPVAGQVALTLDGTTVADSHLYSSKEPHMTICPDLLYSSDNGGFIHYFDYFGDTAAAKYEGGFMKLSSGHICYYVQLPTEMYPLLVQRTAARLLENIGDREGMGAAMQKAQDMEKRAMFMLTPRTDGEQKKIASGGILWPNRRGSAWGVR